MGKALKVVRAAYSKTEFGECMDAAGSFSTAEFECKMHICGERAEAWGGKD